MKILYNFCTLKSRMEAGGEGTVDLLPHMYKLTLQGSCSWEIMCFAGHWLLSTVLSLCNIHLVVSYCLITADMQAIILLIISQSMTITI